AHRRLSSGAAIGLAAGHRRSSCRAVAAEDARVDHGNTAGLDHRDRLLECLLQLAGRAARSEALGTLPARDHPDVDVRIGNALADPLVFDRTVAGNGDTFLVNLVV